MFHAASQAPCPASLRYEPVEKWGAVDDARILELIQGLLALQVTRCTYLSASAWPEAKLVVMASASSPCHPAKTSSNKL